MVPINYFSIEGPAYVSNATVTNRETCYNLHSAPFGRVQGGHFNILITFRFFIIPRITSITSCMSSRYEGKKTWEKIRQECLHLFPFVILTGLFVCLMIFQKNKFLFLQDFLKVMNLNQDDPNIRKVDRIDFLDLCRPTESLKNKIKKQIYQLNLLNYKNT